MLGQGASLGPPAATIATRLRSDPLFCAALAALAGILLADRFPTAWLYTGATLLLGFASWLGRRRGITPARVFGLVLILLGFAAVHAWHLGALQSFPHYQTLAAEPDGLHVQGRGRLLQVPRSLGAGAEQAPFKLSELSIGERTYHLPHTVLLRAPLGSVRYGDVIECSGRLFLPESPRNPGEFDYRTYLQRHDRAGILEVGPADHLKVVSHEPHPLKALALKARERMAGAITRDLPPDSEISRTLTAMVLGMRERTTPEMEKPFRHSGTLHLFAVSGLHVGIFAFIAWLLLKPFGLSRGQVTFLLIPLLFFYAFITGWRPSAVRAATMAAVFLASYALHREPRLLNSLGLAALLILAANTNQLFLPGFQLSFTVLLAIFALTKPLQRPFRRWLYPDPLIPTSLLQDHEQRAYAFRRWFADLFSVSAAAWLGSLPLMALTFHLVTPIALIANGFLLPLGFFILLAAAMSMLCSLVAVLGWANILFNNANFALVHLLTWIAGTFAVLPGGHFFVSNRLPITRPDLEITVLDMPQGGACTHLQARRGSSELIDVGHARSYDFITEPYLKHAGLNRIDRLWLTHGDTSHLSGGPKFLSQYRPKIYQPAWPSRSPSMRHIAALAGERGAHPVSLHAGASIPVTRKAYWEVLYPPEEQSFAPGTADDRGLVLRLSADPWRVLFTADAGLHTEQWLVQSGRNLEADVLIKGSHANDVSGTHAFLDLVQPRLLVWDSETDEHTQATSWTALHPCAVFDQREVGAVILGLERKALTARGFRAPHQVVTLKRAR